ncbi:hypothetical protein EVAR_81580_1 [Eumeta japonica]|uniref:Uncharacterized protein n=1 Tax=Eumeta variegata TaxID=151549 RepID=A0A4C1V172_EUMVA|nr:hypothetical protein EVAR_81580_1 [Eumeta japonica]
MCPEAPDNAPSSSSHSRGYHHGEYPGSYSYDYEVGPYDGGVHGHHEHHDHHEHHHQPHHGHHVEYYHKHHDHGLAAKAFLWPLAGLALLGAAATLVTNPVLLQLGVVTGRKRRSVNYESSTAPATELLTDNWHSFGNLTETTGGSGKRRNTTYRNSKKKTYRRVKSLLTTTPKSSQVTLYVPPKSDDNFNHREVTSFLFATAPGRSKRRGRKEGERKQASFRCVRRLRSERGIIHYELLPPGKTINSDLYYQQLMILKQEVEKKRPELINRKVVVFHHEDKNGSGMPKIYKDAKLEEDTSQAQKELALTLEVTQQVISHRLKSLGIVYK